MGNLLCSVSLTLFEVANELYVAVGSGLPGLTVLISHGLRTSHIFRTITVTAVTAASLVYVFSSDERSEPSIFKVVVITGCDTGLGFSLAHYCCDNGFTVFAGFLNEESKGAQELRRKFGGRLKEFQVDVTVDDSCRKAASMVAEFLETNQDFVLWAVVNNAGVMVFGEFEWHTERLIRQQIDVNLYGTMNFTKQFCPLLRKYKGRIITVTSHCAKETLPGVSVYGATKSGLQAWSDGIRVELGKYGVSVTTIIPGSFVRHSGIMCKQVDNVYEMHSAFTPEQKCFYEDYFKRYNSYLSLLTGSTNPKRIEDEKLYEVFEGALLDERPRRVYLHEPWRYTFYYTLFRLVPFRVRDYLVCKFVKLPEYTDNKISTDAVC